MRAGPVAVLATTPYDGAGLCRAYNPADPVSRALHMHTAEAVHVKTMLVACHLGLATRRPAFICSTGRCG